MSTVLAATDSDRPGSLRALFRRIISPSNQQTNGPGMFEHAQNTMIQNANFIISQSGDIVLGPPLPVTTDPVPPGQSSSNDTAIPLPAHERGTPGSLRSGPKVYVDCLLTKGRGYPLWIPSPNMGLPTSYRALGVSVGDVGVLTSDGGFDFLFNIFHDATHPINAAVGVPTAFVPFTPAPRVTDTQHFVDLNAGSSLTDSSTITVDNGRDRSTTIFEATGIEGAVLMIPEDMHVTKLKITTRLQQYVEENIVVWYRYVKHTLGHDIENGDLHVVYGCRKSTGFGIAAAFNAVQRENTRLSFLIEGVQEDRSRCPYRWDHTGLAETKAGSSTQSNVEFSSTQPVRNQCLFVETVNTRVSPETWKSVKLDTVMYGMPTPNDRESQYGKHGPTGKSSTSGSGSTSISSLGPSHEYVFHPSVILHYILEAITPGLSAYIVCDDDWAPFISDNTLDARDFIDQVLENRIVVENQGMLFFCASSDIDLLKEIDQTRGAQIRFNRMDNSPNTSFSRWRAERHISSGTMQRANTPVQGRFESNYSDTSSEPIITDEYSDMTSATTVSLIRREEDEIMEMMGGTTNNIDQPSAESIKDSTHSLSPSSQTIFTRADITDRKISVGYRPPAPSASTWTEPPWSGWIETTGDALLILEAARQGRIPRVVRRLNDSERRMITSGSVFVFDEEESGIKRWTDGFFWSPSRVHGNFLLYRETDKRGAGHHSTRPGQELMQQEAAASSSTLTRGLQTENSLSRPKTDNSSLSIDRRRERAMIDGLIDPYKFKDNGLMKKTFSVTINGVVQHLISYYKIADVESGRLRSPSSLPELAAIGISPDYLHRSHFRNPPKIEIGTDGIPRYSGESDDIEGSNKIIVSYQSGLSAGRGTGGIANNMLSEPVLSTEKRQLGSEDLSGSSGNVGAKR